MERDNASTPDLLRIIRRRWVTVALAILLTAGVALAISAVQTKSYEATSSIVFGDSGAAADVLGQRSSGSSADAERLAATVVELVSARDVVVRTANALGRSPDSVADSVDVEGKGVSNVVSIKASASSPDAAAQLANTYAGEYIRLRREANRADLREAERALERKLAELTPEQRDGETGRLIRQRANELSVEASLETGSVRFAERAFAPASASSPNVKLNVALGTILGLLIGLAVATLRERVDRRLVDPGEQSGAYGAPVLGAIEHTRSPERLTEAFRNLHARLQHFHYEGDIRCILVTASSHGEGTSLVAWHLARVAALVPGRKVLMIEADLRSPNLASRGLDPSLGLEQVLRGEMSFHDAIQHPPAQEGQEVPDVLTAGVVDQGGQSPSELLQTDAVGELLRRADQEYDLVVIDTPPLGEVADAIPLIRHVDGVLVVSRPGKVTRAAAESLRDLLSALDAPVLGVIVNSAKATTDFVAGDRRPGRRRSGRRTAGEGQAPARPEALDRS